MRLATSATTLGCNRQVARAARATGVGHRPLRDRQLARQAARALGVVLKHDVAMDRLGTLAGLPAHVEVCKQKLRLLMAAFGRTISHGPPDRQTELTTTCPYTVPGP